MTSLEEQHRDIQIEIDRTHTAIAALRIEQDSVWCGPEHQPQVHRVFGRVDDLEHWKLWKQNFTNTIIECCGLNWKVSGLEYWGLGTEKRMLEVVPTGYGDDISFWEDDFEVYTNPLELLYMIRLRTRQGWRHADCVI